VFVVVGLGNPSSEYEETRHNIGFVVVDETAKELGIKFHKENSDYLIGIKNYRNQLIALVKPLTYMNNSGIAVKNIIEQYKLPLENLLVVVDDFNIPIGTIRIRRSGSSGGHNGLESIIYHLQTEDFPRLRCGIGSESMPKNKQELANLVY
jgi:PTH1 family peptidyl-tRNA hydrolase